MDEDTRIGCNQKDCLNDGAYRFTWPGKNESTICEEHVGKLRAVAQAMGLYLQIVPLEAPDRG